MRTTNAFFLAACLLKNSYGTPTGLQQSVLQAPLEDLTVGHTTSSTRQLHGKFLHITDLHPDPFYKIHSSTEEDDACHRGKGLAGTYGAETSDCDSPYTLVNATFKWIKENLRDQVDFVVWTGDSARHDSDENIPRNQDEVLSTNRWVAEKFIETFGEDNEPGKPQSIPIVSTFGNNDILPHNILLSGPNKWLKSYTDIWSQFIPEEQRHGFERGGWYYVEVIPNKLAVFSLNTLYFFDHNAGVDGCAQKSEPGYEHFEWLRIQLQFMRERGMKAILMGHVPPARTDSKQLWDETCWQKYTLWLKQYRDVVVGGLFGHMNIDHFMIQDTKKIDILSQEDEVSEKQMVRAFLGDELSIMSANDYLEELREVWSDLPNPSVAMESFEESEDDHSAEIAKKKKKGKKTKKDKALKKMGGPWGERYQVTMVSPSVVPNYFPTLRVVEYNITGLDVKSTWASVQKTDSALKVDWLDEEQHLSTEKQDSISFDDDSFDDEVSIDKKKKKGKKGKKDKKKKKKPSNPDLTVPSAPSKNSPPGPAYSPQSLTLLGYTQYFANLSHINNDLPITPGDDQSEEVGSDKWHEGKHKGKHPKDKVPKPKTFKFEVEYSTFTDKVYKMKDLTVRSYIKLAHRIGQYKPEKGDEIDEASSEENEDDSDHEDDVSDAGKKHKKKKHHKQHEKNKVWLRFIKRAFVGTLEDEDLKSFERTESHSGEL
ncbi:Endopolyphosphatase [Mollisia scopiformis]|uniref:Endopolyphosphatase n=1 Tax=Mollisia scopiformis TaxID=149040 RepID=A0A194XL66_MOLSC|nr:Endopolyphosphatase [Mollisia scopiformis]KUJ20517.1 Endopolyphosphatase [Mollisia scopiformis]